MKQRIVWGFAALGFLTLVADPAAACSVCFGGSDSAMTTGMNNGILVLLGVVGVVQGGFIALFFSFWRRSKQLRERREGFDLIDGGVS